MRLIEPGRRGRSKGACVSLGGRCTRVRPTPWWCVRPARPQVHHLGRDPRCARCWMPRDPRPTLLTRQASRGLERRRMNTLTVWRFAAVEAAESALGPLNRLVTAGEARVDDAALVSWPR